MKEKTCHKMKEYRREREGGRKGEGEVGKKFLKMREGEGMVEKKERKAI